MSKLTTREARERAKRELDALEPQPGAPQDGGKGDRKAAPAKGR